MYRQIRNTGTWFDQDSKGTLKDKTPNTARGPGLYNTNEQILSNKTKHISHNTGSIPFGSGSDGRKMIF
jgi:hypothetical protein